MSASQVLADVISYNSLLNGFAIMAQWQQAIHMLRGSCAAICALDLHAYRARMPNSNQVPEWQCRGMEQGRIKPTTVTINAAMAACDAGGHAVLAVHMYEEFFQAPLGCSSWCGTPAGLPGADGLEPARRGYLLAPDSTERDFFRRGL